MPYYSKSNKKCPYSSFFNDNDDECKPDFNHTFYFEPLSSLMVRVSNFKNLVILHFAKGNRYLPMREDEINDLIVMHDSIMAQIKKCKKVICPIYKKSYSNKEEQFKSVPSSVKICKLTDNKKKKKNKRKVTKANEKDDSANKKMTQKGDSGDESPVSASDADDSDAENGDDEEE